MLDAVFNLSGNVINDHTFLGIILHLYEEYETLDTVYVPAFILHMTRPDFFSLILDALH